MSAFRRRDNFYALFGILTLPILWFMYLAGKSNMEGIQVMFVLT